NSRIAWQCAEATNPANDRDVPTSRRPAICESVYLRRAGCTVSNNTVVQDRFVGANRQSVFRNVYSSSRVLQLRAVDIFEASNIRGKNNYCKSEKPQHEKRYNAEPERST